jgi:hypothetical protein
MNSISGELITSVEWASLLEGKPVPSVKRKVSEVLMGTLRRVRIVYTEKAAELLLVASKSIYRQHTRHVSHIPCYFDPRVTTNLYQYAFTLPKNTEWEETLFWVCEQQHHFLIMAFAILGRFDDMLRCAIGFPAGQCNLDQLRLQLNAMAQYIQERIALAETKRNALNEPKLHTTAAVSVPKTKNRILSRFKKT